ncbi:MAG: OmpA family protein [Pararhodobacter sp.]|nr:OmpA family protein [Pararhodobacter sp.]
MSRQNDAAPVIIKRKKVSGGHGHHGGAWKVAYADFVTAMMAFFLMMWLLGATTESQRRGLADYFNPSIPLHRISSGGDGLLGGNDIQMPDNMGPGTAPGATDADEEIGHSPTESIEELAQRLRGLGGESAIMTEALRHIVTRSSDEGLVIEVFDLPDSPLFDPDSNTPRPILPIIAGVLAEAMQFVANPAAIEGHTRSYTVVHRGDPSWSLSLSRAERMRQLLESAGLPQARMDRVTGHADRQPAVRNPMASRNNRLEVILLRQNR